MTFEVLVVDDEADIRDLISDILKEEGFNVRAAANSGQVFSAISDKVPNAIILDVWLQGSELDGLGILEIIKSRYPLLPVIVISGHGNVETAVSAIKLGAYDYLEKPFTHEKLILTLKRAYEASKLKRENLELRSKVIQKTELIGQSAAISKLKTEIDRAAASSSRILIYGLTGCGKELTARLIHKRSKRAHKPFIIFSPVGMSQDRIKYELFGEEDNVKNNILKKSLTVLEAAHGGTLYLDEINALTIPIQNKLLHFLQDNKVENKNNLDVRIITSSSVDLLEEIEKGNFREELYYRLNVVNIKVPLLSERKEDVPHLIDYFVKHLAKVTGLRVREFSQDTKSLLQAYSWPGNIRQLKNVIEWTLIMAPRNVDMITPDMLPSEITDSSINVKVKNQNMNLNIMTMPLREAREIFEKQYLAAQMNRFNNNISKTSAFIGMERSALHRKLKTLNLHNAKMA